MPKNKSKPAKKSESSNSDSDSGPEEKVPPKKMKVVAKPEDENSWDLGKNRFVKLSEFKGKWYLNIREFYDSGGELKPTKKGVSLTMEQWQKFKTHMDDIDEAIKQNV